MSILIKGIDMPKKGEHIVALIKSDGECSYWKQDIKYGNCEPMQTVDAIQIPTPHGRLIDANKLEAMMYHEAFETDSDMQKWDSGCWIRYKVFENCMNRLLPGTILEAEE